MLSRPTLFASLAILSSVALFGCDPMMPGVAGDVGLGAGVDTTKFQNMEMRAIVADGEFDPKSPKFPTEVAADFYQDGEGDSTVWTGDVEVQGKGSVLLQRGQPLTGATFPLTYQLGGDGIGSTDEEHWRLFVWLSNNPDSHLDKAPASGDPYGVVDFDANGCGFSDYCGVKDGIDLTIDQTAP